MSQLQTNITNKGIITYLLGAGASANALPIANKYSERFVKFIDFLKKNEIAQKKPKEIDEICTDFNWLIELIENKKSKVDSLAKNFFDKKEFENLNKIKKLLTFFFIIEQIRNPVDRRYRPFIEKIWPEGSRSKLPSNQIRILNWNYDFQVEMALADLANYSNHFDSTDLQRQCILSPLHICESEIEKDFFKNCRADRFSMFHLNGVCNCYKYDIYLDNFQGATFGSDPINSLFNPFEKKQISFETTLNNQLSNYIDLWKRKENLTALDFAFENTKNNRTPYNIRKKIIKKAIKATSNTEVLVIIGYSFPKDNRKFDKKIIGAMKSLRGIHIQDKNPEAIMNKFSKIFPKLKNLLYPIPNVDDFFVPKVLI